MIVPRCQLDRALGQFVYLDPLRERLVNLLRSRGAEIVDRYGRSFPSLLIFRYRGANVVLALMPRPKRPSTRQRRAMRTAWARHCLCLRAWNAEHGAMMLDAIDTQKDSPRP